MTPPPPTDTSTVADGNDIIIEFSCLGDRWEATGQKKPPKTGNIQCKIQDYHTHTLPIMLILEKRMSNPRFLSDQFSLSVQLFEGSIYTVAVVCSFLASWWPQEPWNKHTGGGLAAFLCTVCVPLPCYSHVTLTVVGVSAHLVNKQSVQTQKGSTSDSYSYHHSPLQRDPGALFIKLPDPSPSSGTFCTCSIPTWQQGRRSHPSSSRKDVVLPKWVRTGEDTSAGGLAEEFLLSPSCTPALSSHPST